MAKKVAIRKARVKDIPAAVELWKELMDLHEALDPVFTRSRGGHKAFAEYLRKEYIGGDRRRAWVAQGGHEIIGLCMGAIKDKPPALRLKQHGQIEALVVTKKWRGKGVGEKLLRHALRWLCEKGMSRVEVCHSTVNDLTGQFYLRMGFSPYLKTLFLELPESKVK